VLAFLFSLAVALTLLPAGVGVLIAEAFAIRSWIYHAANGGLAAWIGWSLMQDMQKEYRFLTEPRIMVAAGLAGGLAYWLVAGCTAGFWKPVFRSEPQQV
jgi:multidrug efflux pump subunit AcrB